MCIKCAAVGFQRLSDSLKPLNVIRTQNSRNTESNSSLCSVNFLFVGSVGYGCLERVEKVAGISVHLNLRRINFGDIRMNLGA